MEDFASGLSETRLDHETFHLRHRVPQSREHRARYDRMPNIELDYMVYPRHLHHVVVVEAMPCVDLDTCIVRNLRGLNET